jgi:hypothetical protein
MDFICQNCNKVYKSRVGLWKHNKVCVPKVEEKKYVCTFCNKCFSCRQSRWAHQKTCKTKNDQIITINSETVADLQNRMKLLESKPTIQNNIVNNYTQNIVITSSPGVEPIDYLTVDQKRFIMNKGLSSLMYLIETTNFDKSKPENHSYCVTALNDKHASMVDTKTNSIIKTDKNELYDKVLAGNLSKLEKLSGDGEFTLKEKKDYIDIVDRLKNTLFQTKKGIKKYYSEINILSYNNKDLIQETWNGLKKLDDMFLAKNFEHQTKQIEKIEKNLESSSDIESDEEVNTEKLMGFRKKFLNKNSAEEKQGIINISSDDSGSELSSDTESEDEQEVNEIVIKGINYIIENNIAYSKTTDGRKGQVHGTYINNKLTKTKKKTKDIEI